MMILEIKSFSITVFIYFFQSSAFVVISIPVSSHLFQLNLIWAFYSTSPSVLFLRREQSFQLGGGVVSMS